VRAELDEEDADLILDQRRRQRLRCRLTEKCPTLGLLGIRERAARLGGSVDIQSSPGAGTSLVVRIA